jgi:hypothetical protein
VDDNPTSSSRAAKAHHNCLGLHPLWLTDPSVRPQPGRAGTQHGMIKSKLKQGTRSHRGAGRATGHLPIENSAWNDTTSLGHWGIHGHHVAGTDREPTCHCGGEPHKHGGISYSYSSGHCHHSRGQDSRMTTLKWHILQACITHTPGIPGMAFLLTVAQRIKFVRMAVSLSRHMRQVLDVYKRARF